MGGFAFSENTLFQFGSGSEQALHAAFPVHESRWHSGSVERVNFAVFEHFRKRFAWRDGLNVNFRRQRQFYLFDASSFFLPAGEVARTGHRHGIFVAQDSANPNGSGELIFGLADLFADQIFGLADAAVAIHENAGMAKGAGRKNGNGYERRVIGKKGHHVGGKRHFRGVEFAVAQHAEEGFLDRESQIVEVDAVDGDAAVDERAGAIIVPAGESEWDVRQSFLRARLALHTR